ncbi:DUF6889 family protein [Labrys neptuniae]
MPGGLDWPLRPCRAGLCQYRDLLDGALSIEHLAMMNDLLDVEAENTYRAQEASKSK